MRADEIAPLLFAGKFGGKSPDTKGAIGFHQGQVIEWESRTGENTIRVLGTEVHDLPVLTTADSIMLNEGDAVGILRFQSTYFILGRIAPPGAGAALSIRSDRWIESLIIPESSTFGEIPGEGPNLSNVYIGSSRRCLVFLSAAFLVNNAVVAMGCDVSGASSIPSATTGNADGIADVRAGLTFTGTDRLDVATTEVTMLTAANGLNEGFNEFTCVYRSYDWTDPNPLTIISNRAISVFPF